MLSSLLIGAVAAIILYLLFPAISCITAVRITYILANLGAFWNYNYSYKKMRCDLHLDDFGSSGKEADYLAHYRNKKKLWHSIIGVVYGIPLVLLLLMTYMDSYGQKVMLWAIADFFSYIYNNLDKVIFVLAVCLEIYVHINSLVEYVVYYYDKKALKLVYSTLTLIPAAVLSIAVLKFHPESAMYYCLVCAVSTLCTLKMLMGVVKGYNILSTYPIPQFHKRERGEGFE